MSTHNELHVVMNCCRCGVQNTFSLEVFGGRGELLTYSIGDTVQWNTRGSPAKGGRPPEGCCTFSGYGVCDQCGKDFFVNVDIRNDVIVGVSCDHQRAPYIE
ncbi:MAG: hypothetical protein V4719_29055 [Planctomycetota bacterium]